MIRALIAAGVLCIVFHFAIQLWRSLSRLEKLTLLKSLTYSAVLAILAVSCLTAFVILF